MKRAAAGIGLGLVVVLLAGCGSTTSIPPSNRAAIYTFLEDQPECDVLGMRIDVTGITLTNRRGGSLNLIPASINAIAEPELTSLADTPTLLNIGTVPAGTYVKVSINFSVLNTSIYQPTSNPPVVSKLISITNTTPVVLLSPPLEVKAGKAAGLMVDFNLAQSLETDAQGNITGILNPAISVTPITQGVGGNFPEMNDLVGMVRSVTPQPIFGSPYLGAISFQGFGGTGPAVDLNMTNTSNLFQGSTVNTETSNSSGQMVYAPVQPAQLDQVLPGSFIEADAAVDSQGNLTAGTVQVEDHEDLSKNVLAFAGPILSVNRDSEGSVTGYTQLAREIEPGQQSVVLQGIVVQVNIPSTASLYVAFNPPNPPTNLMPPELNIASTSELVANSCQLALDSNNNPIPITGLPFGPQSLAPGQEVVTSGAVTIVTHGNDTVVANQVVLRQQTIEGTALTILQDGTDDRTGAFQLSTCSTLFGTTPLVVITTSNTNFVNLAGLSQMAGPVLVRGMAFYEPCSIPINGTTIPAGTLVVLANQVHQLN